MKLFSIVVLLLHAIVAHAQSDSVCTAACACRNNQTPAGVMISSVHDKNEWMVSYRFMRMQMSGNLSGDHKIDNDVIFSKYIMAPENMQMDMHMLMLMYGVTDKLTLMLMSNYSVNNMQMDMFASGSHHHEGNNGTDQHQMRSRGFNDIKLYAGYGIIKNESNEFALYTGISLPTGNIFVRGSADDPMYPAKRLPYAMQLGSGAPEFLPTVNYVYKKNKFTGSAQLSGVYRPFYNQLGYRLGHEATLNVWSAYKFWNFISASLRIEATAANNIKGYDALLYYYNEPASHPKNYGGKRVQLFAGTQFQLKNGCIKNHRVGLEYGLPLYQYANGIQMKMQSTLNAAWTFNF